MNHIKKIVQLPETKFIGNNILLLGFWRPQCKILLTTQFRNIMESHKRLHLHDFRYSDPNVRVYFGASCLFVANHSTECYRAQEMLHCLRSKDSGNWLHVQQHSAFVCFVSASLQTAIISLTHARTHTVLCVWRTFIFTCR